MEAVVHWDSDTLGLPLEQWLPLPDTVMLALEVEDWDDVTQAVKVGESVGDTLTLWDPLPLVEGVLEWVEDTQELDDGESVPMGEVEREGEGVVVMDWVAELTLRGEGEVEIVEVTHPEALMDDVVVVEAEGQEDVE